MNDNQISVGVIGLGMMGLTHLDVYSKLSDVRVLAVSDTLPDRLHGRTRAAGNIKGQSQGSSDFSQVRKYTRGMDLIADSDIQLVDICLPTPLHIDYAIAALRAGKHVMLEKPLALTYQDALRLLEVASQSDRLIMPAMCMRFWPGWDWLKQTIDQRAFGAVLSAHFRRVAAHPGGPFYSDGNACGGAILDLHIHDADFVYWCFGMPSAVFSTGYACMTGQIDHIATHYLYSPDGSARSPLVMAEGGWAMAPGFEFTMQYTVNFEHATAVFDLARKDPLIVYQNGEAVAVELPAGMGYEYEIRYFLDCVRHGRRPKTVTLDEAASTLKIIEAERRSTTSRQVEAVV